MSGNGVLAYLHARCNLGIVNGRQPAGVEFTFNRFIEFK